MANLKPFCAIRPDCDKAERVAALPYDVVDRNEAREIGSQNPLSFLHVDRAEMDLAPGIDIYCPEVYQKAKENLSSMIRDGILIQDAEPCFYIYEQERSGRVQTGIVGCASIDDYLSGTIKKHELTREDKELDRIRHVDACNANTGPIFLAAAYPEALREEIHRWQEQHPAVYDFVSEDGIAHRCWKIDEEKVICCIEKSFASIPSLYIADGHHRAASAVKVGLKRRRENPGYDGTEEFNYFLSVVFPYDELTILPYNRIVRDLNGLTEDQLLEKISRWYDISPCAEEKTCPQKRTCRMYVGGKWYLLTEHPDLCEGKTLSGKLDVSVLQDTVLSQVFSIHDPRADERIRFLGGSHSARELACMADETGGAAFEMAPASMEELIAIADAGELMPPKSTWFEPKLRSGLFIHSL